MLLMLNRLGLSLFLFGFIFLFLGVLFYSWGFSCDDCGVIYSSWKLLREQGLFSLFKAYDIFELMGPTNYVPQHQGVSHFRMIPFFYRPLTMLFFAWQYMVFGNNLLWYFLVMIFFHAVNTVIVFNIFTLFFNSKYWAFLGALFFGVHMSLWGWMGWIAAQPYVTSMTCLLLSTVFFFSSLKRPALWKLLVAVFLYAVAVFLFEFVLFYPVFLSLMWFIYAEIQERFSLPILTMLDYFLRVLWLWVVSGLYFIARTIGSSVPSAVEDASWSRGFYEFFRGFLCRQADLYSFIVDISNISFIPGGNRLLKGSLVMLILGFLAYLFYRSKHKRLLVMLGIFMVLFMWIAIVTKYQLRYFYYAIAPFALLVTCLVKEFYDYLRSTGKNVRAGIVWSCCWLVIGGNAYFVAKHMKSRELKGNDKVRACRQLLDNTIVEGRALCFIGFPCDGFWTALAQTLWMLKGEEFPIYYDNGTVVKNLKKHSQNFSISSIAGGFRLQSLNKETLYIYLYDDPHMRLGQKIYVDCDRIKGETYTLDYIFDKGLIEKKPLFVSWDYEQDVFTILDSSHLYK